MKRTTFNGSSDQQAPAPRRPSNLCAANGCPLAGSISDGGSGDCCAYHFGAPPDRWPGITDLIAREHAELANEIVIARRYHAGMPGRNDSEGQRLLDGWQRLAPHGYDLNPGDCIVRDGQRLPVTSYRHWANRCETLLGQLVGPLLARTAAPGAPSVPAGISMADAIKLAGGVGAVRRGAAPAAQAPRRPALELEVDQPLDMPAAIPLPPPRRRDSESEYERTAGAPT